MKSSVEDIVKAKSLKEKTNILHWKSLICQAIPTSELQVNKYYIFASILTTEVVKEINPLIMKTFDWESSIFPKGQVDIVDVKILRVVSTVEESIYHLTDGSNVIKKTKDSYLTDWIICDANLDITRTAEKVNAILQTLNTIQDIEEVSKSIPKLPSLPALPSNPFAPGIGPISPAPGAPPLFPNPGTGINPNTVPWINPPNTGGIPWGQGITTAPKITSIGNPHSMPSISGGIIGGSYSSCSNNLNSGLILNSIDTVLGKAEKDITAFGTLLDIIV